MPITLDAKMTAGTTTTSAFSGTLSHAANVMIVVGTDIFSGSSISVTVGGVNATQLANTSSDGPASQSLWYIYRTAAGNEAVQANASINTANDLIAASFTGALAGSSNAFEQTATTPFSNTSRFTVTVNAGTTGRRVLQFFGAGNNFGTSGAPISPQVDAAFILSTGRLMADLNFLDSSGTVNMTYNFSTTNYFGATIGTALLPVPPTPFRFHSPIAVGQPLMF